MAEAPRRKKKKAPEPEPKRSPVLLIVLGVLWLGLGAFTVWLFLQKGDLEDQKSQLETKQAELEKEITELEENMDKQAGVIQVKEEELNLLAEKVKEMQEELASARSSRAVAWSKARELEKTNSELQTKIDDMLEKQESMRSEAKVQLVENDKLNERLAEMKAAIEEKDKRIAELEGQNAELDSTLKSKYYARNFRFVNEKNEQNVSHKRGRVRDNFIVSFKVEDYKHNMVGNKLRGLKVEIRGMSEKNRTYRKTREINSLSGGTASLVFNNENFEKGLYNIEVTYRDNPIGGANFIVR